VRVATGGALAGARGELYEPEAFFFLRRRNEEAHRVSPLTSLEAIGLLARENLRPLDRRGEGAAGDAFRVTVRLAERCRCFAVSAGPTIAGLAAALQAALES